MNKNAVAKNDILEEATNLIVQMAQKIEAMDAEKAKLIASLQTHRDNIIAMALDPVVPIDVHALATVIGADTNVWSYIAAPPRLSPEEITALGGNVRDQITVQSQKIRAGVQGALAIGIAAASGGIGTPAAIAQLAAIANTFDTGSAGGDIEFDKILELVKRFEALNDNNDDPTPEPTPEIT